MRGAMAYLPLNYAGCVVYLSYNAKSFSLALVLLICNNVSCSDIL